MLGRFIKRIFLTINALAVSGLLLAFLSAYVNPLQASFVSLFSLAYPYFVSINIVFILGWVLFRKWYFLISFCALLLGIRSLPNNFQFLPTTIIQAESNKPTFKVMSYNVRLFDLYSWSKNIQTRDSIFSFLRSESPNVVCFQEYYNGKKNFYPIHDSLMMNQSFKYAHVYYTDQLSNSQKFGIATYSDYPIVNKGLVRFPNSSNVSIYTDIKIDTDTIRVFNCHLESIRFLPEDYNFIDSLGDQDKQRKLEGAQGVYKRLSNAYKKRGVQTSMLSSEIDKSPHLIVLCGDFNDPPSSFTYHSLTQKLFDSFVLKGHGKGSTFSRNIFSYRIDYILLSPSINCFDFSVSEVDFSDHFPIVGTYQIAN